MARTLQQILLASVLATAVVTSAWAATSNSESPASAPASAPAPAASAARTVADTVAQIAASEALQREALAHLEQTEHWRALAQRTAALEADFGRLAVKRAAEGELVELLGLEHQTRALKGNASAIVDELSAILRRLEQDRGALETESRLWQERLLFLREQRVPAPVLDRADAVETALQSAGDRVRDVRDSALLDFVKAFTLQARIVEASAGIARRVEHIRAQRLELETASLWQLRATAAQFGPLASELRTGDHLLREYLSENGAQLALAFFGVLLLTRWLLTRSPSHDAMPAQGAPSQPGAASLLIALVSLWVLAPSPPIVFYEVLLALAPIPAALLASRTFAAAIPLTIGGLAIATVLLSLRNILQASPVADRALLLLQAISLGVPVAVDLHRGRLRLAFSRWSPDTVRTLALVVVAASAVTALHVFIGFSGPARSLRSGSGSVLGFALVFGATAFAVYGVVLVMLGLPPLRWFRSARAADPALLRALRWVLAVLTVGGVTIITLGNLRLTPATLSAIDALMDSTLDVGALSISTSAIAASIGIALAALAVTVVTEFVLDREIFPRLNLRPGTGYAIATFTRWTMIIVGAMLALAALGLDMTKVTLIAGALGVGIGFGLQNIVNNFVSGLILIVERPVSVGDLIEIGPLTGEIQRIGIRSSSVKTTHGAEVIVPNADLASKEVINWTRSDRQRRYDINVSVAYGSEPEPVMRLLVEAAMEVPEILTDPAPLAKFEGFGDTSLNFNLLAWVGTIDVGDQAQNALRIAILGKLGGTANLTPLPQREVHLHAIKPPARPADGAPV